MLAILTWPHRIVCAKYMQSSSAKAKVFNYVEDFFRFGQVTWRSFLRDDYIQIHVSMDEVTIGWSPHCTFDTHQAVFLIKEQKILVTLDIQLHVLMKKR